VKAESIPETPLLRILVVEDHEPFRQFLCLKLQSVAHFRTIQAADGLEAVQKAAELQPDLILLDIHLPKLNGIEAAKRIRKIAPHAGLLFVSLESSSAVIRETFRVGAQGYVQKVRAESDLLPAIEAVLGGNRFVSRGLDWSESADAHASHRHEILFCADDAAIVGGLTRFIAVALNAGNAALVLVTESHRDRILQGLRANVVDIDAAIQRGTYLSWDADEPPDPVRFFEVLKGLLEAAAKAGKAHPRVALCGERAGRLWADGRTDEALQLEQLCSTLGKSHDVDMLCVYPVPHGQEDHPSLTRICAEHSVVSSG
jgi:DNA-binding NarL/FixJ family response regulator